MLREVRRFSVRSEAGDAFEMVEVMAFFRGRAGLMDSAPTFFLANGCQALPRRRFGEYDVPQLGVVVREFRQRRPLAASNGGRNQPL